jgi:dephospho-CoA kinase
MLEHQGAYGIDADTLAHRVIARGAPGFQQVVDLFGRYVLGADQEIDRTRLGRIVFNDPSALSELENIIHPLVTQVIDYFIRRARQPVIVVEAIKLFEAGLAQQCDSIWVSSATPEKQFSRLVDNRKMSDSTAQQRIAAQPPQAEKVARAHVIITTNGSFEDTWRQVVAGWKKHVPAVPEAIPPVKPKPAAPSQSLVVERGRPRHAGEIAAFANRLGYPYLGRSGSEVMAAFGEKAFLMLKAGTRLSGVASWQVENLISRVTDLLIDPQIGKENAYTILLNEMEQASRDLQCEAALVFIRPGLTDHEVLLNQLGYTRRTPQTLGVQAWEEAAIESMPANTLLFFKQLRADRILRPI